MREPAALDAIAGHFDTGSAGAGGVPSRPAWPWCACSPRGSGCISQPRSSSMGGSSIMVVPAGRGPVGVVVDARCGRHHRSCSPRPVAGVRCRGIEPQRRGSDRSWGLTLQRTAPPAWSAWRNVSDVTVGVSTYSNYTGGSQTNIRAYHYTAQQTIQPGQYRFLRVMWRTYSCSSVSNDGGLTGTDQLNLDVQMRWFSRVGAADPRSRMAAPVRERVPHEVCSHEYYG